MNNIYPLPNDFDISCIEEAIEDLKKYFPEQKEEGSYIYNKKFFKTQQRIGFLKSHPKEIYESIAIQLNTELQIYRVRNK